METMQIDTGIRMDLEVKPKRRGRPPKQPSNDDNVNARREKNRAAQKIFRQRQQAADKDQKTQFESLEFKLNHILSIFLSISGQTLNSEWAQRDTTLMDSLRSAISNILNLIGDGQDSTVSETFFNSSNVQDVQLPAVEQAAEPEIPQMTEAPAVETPWPSTSTPAPYSQPEPFTNHSSSESVGSSETDNRLMTNIFGNGWMGQPGSFNMFARTGRNEVPRLDSPLSLQITFMTMQRGYYALLHAVDLNDPRIRRGFGHLLRNHSKEEILRSFRWHLGPGLYGLSRLATSKLTGVRKIASPGIFIIDNVVSDDDPVPESESVTAEYCNADDLVKLLWGRTQAGPLEEVFDASVTVKPQDALPYGDLPSFPMDPFSSSPDVSPWYGMEEFAATTETTTIIRVSRSMLLTNISRSGSCFGSGPVFRRADVDKMLINSAVPVSF